MNNYEQMSQITTNINKHEQICNKYEQISTTINWVCPSGASMNCQIMSI